MTYIKKMVIQGFKSFPRKTELPLENSMNVIVGPNGSGKSNLTDALCFVLGRLSIKSIRAARAANLLFNGNKTFKPAQEASVELIFDNKDKTFPIDKDELSIKRTVRKNGLSIYRINNETKTRQDLLEIMAQAGIDPNGFNIILQGEIASLIKQNAEERRKIIEEVAGISIYETRKEKSLRELEKTDEQLKEVNTVLKEKTAYLKNLEKEKQDAANFQKLKEMIDSCKKTLIEKSKKEKEKEIQNLEKIIDGYSQEIEKQRKLISDKNIGIEELQTKITEINKKIQEITNNEQDVLHRDISDLKADLSGLNVRKENFENRLKNAKEKIEETIQKKKNTEKELESIKNQSPEIRKTQEKQKTLSSKFEIIEQQRRNFYMLKSELNSTENKKSEKEKYLIEIQKEEEIMQKSIKNNLTEIKYAKSIEASQEIKINLKQELENFKNKILGLEKAEIETEKQNAILEEESHRESKQIESISNLDKCTLCKQSVTEEHKNRIISESKNIIEKNKSKINQNFDSLLKIRKQIDENKKTRNEKIQKINELEIDLIKLKSIEEKKLQIEKIDAQRKTLKEELAILSEKIQKLKQKYEALKNIETDYDETRLKLQELNYSNLDIDSEVSIKQREISKLDSEKKFFVIDIEESNEELKKIIINIEEKEKKLKAKEEEESKLYQKSEDLFNKRNEIQDKQKVMETDIMGYRFKMRELEDKLNENKIQNAQIKAKIESFNEELKEYGSIELSSGTPEQIKERLLNAQLRISKLGNVNLKALEIFEQLKEQVDSIKIRVETIDKEKEKIQQIIAEIDKKKKKAFIITLDNINQLFTRNFSQLSRKGEVSLELEDPKNPFSAGLNILIRVSKSKYFDVTSLSGGEKTLVALSLIFAIQEYKPYCFYIFDEIDAALDKHNSELLASLVKKYMKTGQYIIITHNDTLITEATTLYGVSMQDSISKIVSLRV